MFSKSRKVDPRVLVLCASGQETDLVALQAVLRRRSIPHDVIVVQRQGFSADCLRSAPRRGRYAAVFLATGDLSCEDPVSGAWRSVFTSDDWQALDDYEREFEVRRVLCFAYPSPAWEAQGLAPGRPWTTEHHALLGELTTAGRKVFADLQPDVVIPLRHAQIYLAPPGGLIGLVPLVVTTEGDVVVSVRRYEDGRECLASSVANGPALVHTLLLAGGIVDWATRGLFSPAQAPTLNIEVDDVFMANYLWDPAVGAERTELTYRLNGVDIEAFVSWLRRFRAQEFVADDFRVELAFVGSAADAGDSETDLAQALRGHEAEFEWCSHTWDHLNFDHADEAGIVETITANQTFAEGFGFTHYDQRALVQGSVSGLQNPAFARAAARCGVRYVVADTSTGSWSDLDSDRPRTLGVDGQVVAVPRRPTNLFCNVTTPDAWVDEYNACYGTNGTWTQGDDVDYAELLRREAGSLLRHLLARVRTPVMVHQANLRAYDGVHSLLGDLIDATVSKYGPLVRDPVQSRSLAQIGASMAADMYFAP